VTDQLEDLFADLRADELIQIRPPGAAAARRTVHRRRTTKAVGGAAFVAVVAAGGLGSYLLGPAHTSESSLPDPATLAKRQSRAATAVGIDPSGQAATPHSAQGVAAAGIIATEVLVAGTYTLRFACVGPGRLSVAIRSRTEVGQSPQAFLPDPQSCVAGQATTTSFVLAVSSTVDTELQSDDDAIDRSAYAFQLTLADTDLRRLGDESAARLSAAVPDSITSVSGPLTDGSQGIEDETLKAGRYLLSYTCIGVGQISMTLSVRSGTKQVLTSSRTLGCTDVGPLQTIPFEIPVGPNSITSITITPDPDANGQAAYAAATARG